jgi:O-antigen/teichoic acid export membrane protein
MQFRKALSFSVFSAYSEQIIGLISVIAISRLLTPQEIGLFAISTSLFVIVSEFRVLGVGSYIIREKEMGIDKIKGSYGVLIFLSWSIGLAILATAGMLENFYQKKDLADLIRIQSIGYFIGPYANLASAIIARELQFDKIYNIHVFTAVSRLVSTILLIYLGFSYYSLAIGMIFGSFVQLFLCIHYRTIPLLIMPSTYMFFDILKAGFFITITNVTKLMSDNFPDLILGKVKQLSDVAFFSRGLGIILYIEKLLIQAISPVILPHYSKEMNQNNQSIADLYAKTVSMLTMIVVPVYAVVNLMAYPMIVFLFGDQWVFAVDIASILAIWAMLISVHALLHFAMISVGLEKSLFKKDVAIFLIKVGLFIYAATNSLTFIAWAMVLAGLIEFLINSYYAVTKIGMSYATLFKVLVPGIFTAAVCWSVSYGLSFVVDMHSDIFLSIFVNFVVISICWLLMIVLMKHELYYALRELTSNFIQRKA